MGKYIEKLLSRMSELEPLRGSLREATALIVSAVKNGNKLLTCGNGGSAADAEHIVGELMKGFLLKRPLAEQQRSRLLDAGCPESLVGRLQQGVPAISLVAGIALPTAFGNDVCPELVFAQQVFALGKKGDVLIAISTSGNSKNVLDAVLVAKANGLSVMGMTGAPGGAMQPLCDILITAPSDCTFRIQEYHLPIYHALCADIEAALYA